MDNSLLIEKIQRLCKFEAIAPTKACIDSGAGKDFIANLIKGRTPSVEKVQLLATYLGVTTSELLGEKPPTTDELLAEGYTAQEIAEAREAMDILSKLNAENYKKAKDHLDYLLAKQAEDEKKKRQGK